jgi:hypothetical protein
MSARGRAVLSGLALSAFFALPLLPEILGTRRLVFRDAHITHWPWRRVAMETLAADRPPFVNAGASGGQPLLANPNAVLLYPTVLLEKILPPASAFNLHYLLQVLWAFFGARLLARRLGRSEGAAFLCGAAYAFSGTMLSYASGFANSSAAAAWLPWCGAAALWLARAGGWRESLRRLPALSLALGLQLLAGEPAISLLTLVFVVAIGVGASGTLVRAGRFIASAAGAGVAASAFAAPLLLPLWQVLPLTYRGQHLYSDRAFGASPFAAWRAIEWLFPRFSGEPGALGVGAHWQHALERGDLLYIWCVTFGVLPFLLLALAALSRGFWRGTVPWLAGGAVVTLLFAFGSSLPFYRALGQVELLRRLRYPIKFYLLTTLCVALLAAFAVDHFSGRRIRKREAAGLGASALLFFVAFAAAREGGRLESAIEPLLSGLAAPPAALLPAILGVFRGDALLGLAAVALLAGILLWRPRAPAAGYLFGLGTVCLSFFWGLPLFVSADERDLQRPPALLSAMKGAGRLFISPRLPEFNVLRTGTAHPQMAPRVSKLARVQVEELIPGTGEPFGARYLFDADPDGSYGYYNRLASEAFNASTAPEKSRLLRAFGGRWILAEEGEHYPMTRAVTGLTVAGRRLVLLELEAPIAEVRWAGREFRRGSLSGALELVRSEGFDPSTDVVLPGAADGDGTGTAAARLRPEAIEPDRLAVQVEADGPGFLILSRTFVPAWNARLDGKKAPVMVANARELAVAVPSGSHRIEVAWDEAPFYRGVAVQAGALLVLLAAALLATRSQVRNRGVDPLGS